jgi:hypothetical protein
VEDAMKVQGKYGKTVEMTSARWEMLYEVALGHRHIGRRKKWTVPRALEEAGLIDFDIPKAMRVALPAGIALLEAHKMSEVENRIMWRAHGQQEMYEKLSAWGKTVADGLVAKGFVLVNENGYIVKPKVRPGTIVSAPEKNYGWRIKMDDGANESLFTHSDICPPEGTPVGTRGTVEYIAEKGGPANRIGYHKWVQAS